MSVPTRFVLSAGAAVLAASFCGCGGERVKLEHDPERSAKLLEGLKAQSPNWAAASADYNRKVNYFYCAGSVVLGGKKYTIAGSPGAAPAKPGMKYGDSYSVFNGEIESVHHSPAREVQIGQFEVTGDGFRDWGKRPDADHYVPEVMQEVKPYVVQFHQALKTTFPK
jgi:hypothetical protein